MAIRKNNRNELRVLLWGQEIGTLTWNPDKQYAYFFFSEEYFRQPYDLCPITAPKDSPEARQAIYGPSLKSPDMELRIYQGLPPFLADSLPDRWGNAVFDQWFHDRKLPDSQKNPLTKLSFIGSRAMGAFEFRPALEPGYYKDRPVDLGELYKEVLQIEENLRTRTLAADDEKTRENINALGTSPGGSRKKAIVSIAPDGSFHSGKTALDPDWKHCILKFNYDDYSTAETEMTYYELATEAGIRMMPSRLISIGGSSHFLTERFDRTGGRKQMMQTLAAINPQAASYEDLVRTCRTLGIDEREITELFRQTVFNFLMNNTDDHSKNFSFLMDDRFRWHLSPAYDMTFIIAESGNTGEHAHCMSLGGKTSGVTDRDLLDFAAKNGIKAPQRIIDEIRMVSLRFEEKARKYGVKAHVIEIISRKLDELGRPHQKETNASDFTVEGVAVAGFRFEMTHCGNIHVVARVDERALKLVVTPKKPLFKEIMDKGFNGMSETEKAVIFKQYLLPMIHKG